MSVSPASIEIEKTSQIEPYRTMRGPTEGVLGVVHLPDGRHIITCFWDGSLRLWDRESGAQIENDWRDDGDQAGVLTISLSPNGKTVVSGSMDGIVRLWDIGTRKVTAKWTGHTEGVWSVCWSANGGRVASGSDDGTVRVWEVKNGETAVGLIKTGHQEVDAVAYSPDALKIATGGSKDREIKIWDAWTGELLSTVDQVSYVRRLAWTSDQKKLIVAGGNHGSIMILNTVTWEQVAILDHGKKKTVNVISLFQNGRLLASGSLDNTVRLWNLDTNLPVGLPLQHEDYICGAAFSVDGMFLFTTCDDNNGYVWDTHTMLKNAGLEDLLSVPINATDDNDSA